MFLIYANHQVLILQCSNDKKCHHISVTFSIIYLTCLPILLTTIGYIKYEDNSRHLIEKCSVNIKAIPLHTHHVDVSFYFHTSKYAKFSSLAHALLSHPYHHSSKKLTKKTILPIMTHGKQLNSSIQLQQRASKLM